MRYSYNTASPDRYLLLKGLAEKNRQYPTDAEKVLWKRISKRSLGHKFNRQHIIGDYIVDFVCLERHLIIEVDGEYHHTEEQMRDDEERTEALERMGFEVVRFENIDVLRDTDKIIEKIKSLLNDNKNI